MNFITISQLNQDIVNNLYRIPSNVELIVGVPKSGMLVATLIALQLNIPLTDLDSFLDGRIYHNGSTKQREDWHLEVKECNTILVVDDSIYSGNEIRKVKQKLSVVEGKRIIYLAGYVVKENADLVDIYFKECTLPRMFEWNYMHHPLLKNTCVDIDGVLCRDPIEEENDDGEKYIYFLKNVEPRIVPTHPIGCLVSCRLEKYRSLTEEWLKKNRIQYDQLFMMPYQTQEERMRANNYGQYKANIYKKNKEAELFIESNRKQAEEIWAISKKSVFCIENTEFYEEGNSRKVIRYISKFEFLPYKIQKMLKHLKRKILAITHIR